MSDHVVRLSKEQSEFIEATFNKQDDLYWCPFYFTKKEDRLWEISLFRDAPDSIRHIVEQWENPNPGGDKA